MAFFDESFWVAISFCVFLGCILKPAKNAVVNMLDSYIVETSKKLKEAEAIKKEAEELLTKAQHESVNSHEIASSILAKAQEDSALILEEAAQNAKLLIASHAKAAKQRLQKMEEEIMQDIINEAVNLAMEEVNKHFVIEADDEMQQKLFDTSFQKAKKILH
jgi:F-type H+-transporting ATPase subunit b